MKIIARSGIFIIFISSFLCAGEFGPDVSKIDGKSLKWEDGAQDYFVMFKTLLENLEQDTNGNPQADNCIDSNIGTSFNLTKDHIPEDANVKAAYLIWMSALPSEEIPDGLTDNTVTLSFEGTYGTTLKKEISATDSPRTFSDLQDFNFAAVENLSLSNSSCESNEDCLSEENPEATYECIEGTCGTRAIVYTYRADVTDFFKEIHSKNRNSGINEDGTGLVGKYTVSNMDCTNDFPYLYVSGLVGGWALVFVYSSEKINPKKIYFYDGFEASRYNESIISLSGFKLPYKAIVKFTMIAAEGDPNLASATTDIFQAAPPEGISISSENNIEMMIYNACNLPKSSPLTYVEIFNSISSLYGWKDTKPTCIGGDPQEYDPDLLEYAIDVDTFVLSSEEDFFDSILQQGNETLKFKVGTNQDQVFLNFLAVSIDTASLRYDIPETTEAPSGREINYCSCSEKTDSFCVDRPFYYTIQIENHSENLAENVTIKNELPENVEYIPESTEIIKTVDGKIGKWEKISDIDGEFPLKNEYKVMEMMRYCDEKTHECKDSVFIRYKVQPSNKLQQFEMIKNTAIINDDSEILYNTNKSIPLILFQDSSCPSIETCPEPSLETCGPQESEDTGDTGDTGNTGDSGNSGTSDTSDEDNTSSGESSCSVVII